MKLETMLEIAERATKGDWEAMDMPTEEGTHLVLGGEGQSFGMIGDCVQYANALHIATFNPRTAQALVKAVIAANALVENWKGGEPEWEETWRPGSLLRNLNDALSSALGDVAAEPVKGA